MAEDQLSPEISRRDFLRGKLRMKEKPHQDAVSRSIQEHLGITPDQVHLNFTFGVHYFTNRDYDYAKQHEVNVILGEFNRYAVFGAIESVGRAKPDLSPELELNDKLKLLATGYGGSQGQKYDNTANILRFIQDGGLVVSTDGSSPPHLTYKPEYLKAVMVGAALLTAASPGLKVAVSAGLDAHHYKDVSSDSKYFPEDVRQWSRREMIKSSILSLAGITYTGSVIGGGIGLKGMQLMEDMEKVINKLDKPEYVGTIEAVVVMRNKMMALNTWASIARMVNKENQDKLSILFHAGVAHHQARDEFTKGPEKLEEDIRTYVKILITDYLDQYLPNLQIERNKRGEIIDFKWQNEIYGKLNPWTSFFSQPFQFGLKSDGNEPIATFKPMTAREIFYDELGRTISNIEKEGKSADTNRLDVLKYIRDISKSDDKYEKEVVDKFVTKLSDLRADTKAAIADN